MSKIRTRAQILIENAKVTKKIEMLEARKRELVIEHYQICDGYSWYREMEEQWKKNRRSKETETVLVGRVCWNEDFIDEDTGNVVTILRTEVVRINGEWQ